MTNEQHRLESAAKFDARTRSELEALEARISDEEIPSDEAGEMRNLYRDKHTYEKENSTAPMSESAFLQVKAFTDYRPTRTRVPAIPEEAEHASRTTEPPEAVLEVAATLSRDDEAPPVLPENDNWKKVVGHINRIHWKARERSVADVDLRGNKRREVMGATEAADGLEAEIEQRKTDLATMADERILLPEEIARKHQLQNELRLTEERYQYVIGEETKDKRNIDTADRTIDASIDLAVRDFETLPEELQGAIRTTNEDILRKYDVNVWASQEVRGELFRREREEERGMHEQRLTEERTEKQKMTPRALARAMNTPLFATYSKKDILTVLESEGIAATDVAVGLRELESRYASSSDGGGREISAVPIFEDIVAEGIEAGLRAQLQASTTAATTALPQSDTVVPPPAENTESTLAQTAVITPETTPVFVPPSPERLVTLVGELNDAKKGIDESYELERKGKEGGATEEEIRKARRLRDRLNTLAQKNALQIAGGDALFGTIKLPDLAAVEVYKKAVPRGLRGEEKRKAEATLTKDARDAYYDAIRRKRAFIQSLVGAGVDEKAATHLFQEFARHAKGFAQIVENTKEGDGSALQKGYGAVLLNWHGIEAKTLDEVRLKMQQALDAYNAVPPHVEPAKPEALAAAPAVAVSPEATGEDIDVEIDAYPPYALGPESYDEVPVDHDSVYGGDIFAPLSDDELAELKKMRKPKEIDERAPYTMLEGNEDELLGDSRVRMPMTKRDGAKKDPLAVDVLRNTMAVRAARANEEMDMLDTTSRRYITTKKTEAWEAMTPEEKKAMIERHWSTFITDGIYLVDVKNGNAPEEWNYLGIDDVGNVGFVDNNGGKHSFGVEQLEGEDSILMTLQSAPISTQEGTVSQAASTDTQRAPEATPRLTPREYAEKKREDKRNAVLQKNISDMQARAGVTRFSNRQLEDMEEDGAFERMKTDTTVGVFEGDMESRKNREKWQLADLTAAFEKSSVLTFDDIKALLGVGRKSTQELLDTMLSRGMITLLGEGKYQWVSKEEKDPAAPTALAAPESGSNVSSESAPKVKSFATAKGSIYTYLPDGRVSRFKAATGEQMEAQDLTVFVDITTEEEQRFLYAIHEPDKGEYVTLAEFGAGTPVRIVTGPSDISDISRLHLCIVRDNIIVVYKRATQTPAVGLQAFDTNAFQKDGKPWVSMHLGNKVTEISYEGDSDTEAAGEQKKETANPYIFEASGFKAGDNVIATIAGVDYPSVLRAFTKDGTHAFVEGSNTGIPVEHIRKDEKMPQGEKTKEATANNELDKVGALWASFIEREYGLDINGKPLSESVAEATPKGATPPRISVDIDLNELEKLGTDLESMAIPEVAPAPAAAIDNERVPAPIQFGVVKQFENKFGIDEDALGLLDTFAALSPEKQMLVLKNLEQATLTDIKEEAKKKQQEEWGGKPKWKRALQGVLSLGLVKNHRIREIEKELLAKGKGVGATFAEGNKILAKKLSTIEELAKVAAAGPEVEIIGGEMLIKYVSLEDLFGSLGDKKLTAENLKSLEAYNSTATAYAKLPHEWGYKTTALETQESKQYKEKKHAYETARAGLLSVFSERFGELGEANPEVAAMRKMNKLDEQVALHQLFNQHPDAETALQSIEDTSAIKYAAKEFWNAKGKFAAGGALARGATIALTGALASPAAPAALLAVGTYGMIASIGTAVGFKVGRREGNLLVRERRASGRISNEDAREEIEFVKTKDGEPTGEKGKRKIREFTDAASFVDRIDRLTAKLESETDPTAKALLEQKITQTTSLMAAKLRHGMINFGGSSLDHADTRKGASIANRLAFMQAMSRGVIETAIDRDALDKESESLLNLRQTKIEGKRKVEIEKVASRAALIRGGFALGGAMLADLVHEFSAKGDFNFMKKIAAVQENVKDGVRGSGMLEPGAGVIRKEGFPGMLISQAEVDHSLEMYTMLGNRSLSLDESRALWRTDPDVANPASTFYDTPRGQAHVKLMQTLLGAEKTLTPAEINEIYKSVGFDAATGKKLPHELPGYVQKEVVIPKTPAQPASVAENAVVKKPETAPPSTTTFTPKVSEAEQLEQAHRDAIRVQREEAAHEVAKKVHKESLDQAAQEEKTRTLRAPGQPIQPAQPAAPPAPPAEVVPRIPAKPAVAPSVTTPAAEVTSRAPVRPPESPSAAPALVEVVAKPATIQEIVRSVSEAEAKVGRDLSPGEMVTVKSLKNLEAIPPQGVPQGAATLARETLIAQMKAKGDALTPTEMYNIFKGTPLEGKVNVVPDDELREQLLQKK